LLGEEARTACLVDADVDVLEATAMLAIPPRELLDMSGMLTEIGPEDALTWKCIAFCEINCGVPLPVPPKTQPSTDWLHLSDSLDVKQTRLSNFII